MDKYICKYIIDGKEKYSCVDCDKKFTTRQNAEYHVKNKVCRKDVLENRCNTCNKKFSSVGNLNKHIKNVCSKENNDSDDSDDNNHSNDSDDSNDSNNYNDDSDDSDDSYNIDVTQCPPKDKVMMMQLIKEFNKFKKTSKKEFKKIKKESQKKEKEYQKKDKEINQLKKQIMIAGNNNSINDNHNAKINSDNKTINNIVLVGYGSEDMTKLDNEQLFRCIKAGGTYQSTCKLTNAIHFNPKHPEYHNIYISNMKNKYAMEYKNDQWCMVTKVELIDKIYRNKKEYIEENFDKFYESLNPKVQKSFREWLDTEEDEEDQERVKKVKEDITLLLFNKKNMAKKLIKQS